MNAKVEPRSFDMLDAEPRMVVVPAPDLGYVPGHEPFPWARAFLLWAYSLAVGVIGGIYVLGQMT